jgi:hypothetical protein
MLRSLLLAVGLVGCVTSSTGGTRQEDKKKGEDKVNSYCFSSCASRDPDGGCAKFTDSMATTCAKFLHYKEEDIKTAETGSGSASGSAH